MNTVYLTARQLQAARIIAAEGDIRYYLNGVYVEAGKDCTRIVATDGHEMIVYDYPHGMPQWQGEFIIPNATIDMLNPKAQKGGYETITIEVNETYGEHDVEHKFPRVECTLTYVDVSLTFKPIEGKFPDYTHVIPTIGTPSWWCVDANPGIHNHLPTRIKNVNAGTVDPDTITMPEHLVTDVLERMSQRTTPATYNPEYLADWAKVGRVFSKKAKIPFNLYQNGDLAALVTIPNQPNIIGVLMPVRNPDIEKMPVTDMFRARLAKTEEKTPVENKEEA